VGKKRGEKGKMKLYNYKVEFFPIEELRVGTGIDKAELEETLNTYAANGWRLRETALCGELGFICVFEKQGEEEEEGQE
jgi:hypothetical protein